MSSCSRCGSYHPNPGCYVCAEDEDTITSRQEMEEMRADYLRDKLRDDAWEAEMESRKMQEERDEDERQTP